MRVKAFVVVAGLLLCRSVSIARTIQGSVGQVDSVDAAALGQVGFRIYSALPGGMVGINSSTTTCVNVRCMRSYVNNVILDPGGYVSNAENSQSYNGGVPDQPFYQLVDASLYDAAGNHIGYFGISGVTANNAGVGSFLSSTCSGTTPSNCFARLDSQQQAPPLTNTLATYGGPPHTIRAIGGLNPIPDVKIDSVSNNIVQIHWNDPPTYTAAMRPSTTAPAPPSPVLGVRLWRLERPNDCNLPTANDPGWMSLGTFNLGQTSTQVALNNVSCTFFALTVRLNGPGGTPHEIETFRVGANSVPVQGNFGDCFEGMPCGHDLPPCVEEVCENNRCVVHLLSGELCNDDNGCTVNDVCSDGNCIGTPIPPPPEVENDRFFGRTTLEWDAVPNAAPGTVYDVTSGRADELPTGTGANEACRAANLTEPSLNVPETPPLGTAFWYLVRARDSCAGGSWGSWSNGAPRQLPACP